MSILNRIDEALGAKLRRKNSPIDLSEQVSSQIEDITFSIESLLDMKEVSVNEKNRLRKVIKQIRDIESDILKDI